MRLARLAIGLIVLIALVAFPQLALAVAPAPSSAAAPEQQEEAEGLLSIRLDIFFDEKGEWVADVSIESPGYALPVLGGSIEGSLKLTNQSYASLADLFGLLGMPMALPRAAPGQVQAAAEGGLSSVAVAKSFKADGSQDLRLYANDRLLVAVGASDPLLMEALAQLGLAQIEDWLLAPLMESTATVVLHFPVEGAAEVALADELEPKEGPHKNMISLGATAEESDGALKIVSVAGFSVDEVKGIAGSMGIPFDLPPIAMPVMLSDYDVQQLVISAGQDGLRIDAGDGRWVSIGWDADSRAAIVEMLPAVGNFLYWDFGPTLMYLAQFEPWIEGTGIELDLYISSTPQESVPTLSIREPIAVELATDGGVAVAGYDLGAMGVSVNMAAMGQLADALPVAARWDGESSRLDFSAFGAQMPAVSVNTAALPGMAGLLNVGAVPMDKVAGILEGAHLEVAVGVEGGPEPVALDYEIMAPAEPAKVLLVPSLVIDQEGNFGVGVGAGAAPLRVNTILDGLGVDMSQIKEMAKLYALGYSDDLDMLGITVAPASIDLTVDTETAAKILWDENLRQNLLTVVEGYYPIPDKLPLVGDLFPDWEWKSAVLNAAVGSGWGQWGVNLSFSEETLPASGLEDTLKAFGLLK